MFREFLKPKIFKKQTGTHNTIQINTTEEREREREGERERKTKKQILGPEKQIEVIMIKPKKNIPIGKDGTYKVVRYDLI